MQNHQPYMVLWKCGSIDIDRSHDNRIQPKANANARNTAILPWME